MASMKRWSRRINRNRLRSAAEVRRREMVLLLILASVQFTSIVDFMVVMPLGPQLQRKLEIDNCSVWLDRRVVYGRRGPGGAVGLVDHGSVRPQVGVLDALRGLLAGDALLWPLDRILHVARGPGAHGCISEEFWAAWRWRSSPTFSRKNGAAARPES